MPDVSVPGPRAQVFQEAAERAVASRLTRDGWEVKLDPGGHAVVDMIAQKPRHQTRYLQVQASETGTPEWPAADDIARLVALAGRNKGLAVVAFAKPLPGEWQISCFSAITGRQLDAD